MLKATEVYCYKQGCKSMLSIREIIWQNRPFFDIGGDDLAKLTRLQMSNFLPKMKWRPKKGHHVSWCPVLGHENIGGGYIPPWICTHGYEEVRNYGKTLFIQSIVEGGWDASLTSPHLLKDSNWECWTKHDKSMLVLVFLCYWSILVLFGFWGCSFGLLFFLFYIV